MSENKVPPSQSYMFMFGAAALIAVRFIRKDFHDWGSIDYFIAIVCAGTIIFSVLTLLKRSR